MKLLSTPELIEVPKEKRVPDFTDVVLALLQVTVIGFKGMRISENARRITGLLRGLTDDLGKVGTELTGPQLKCDAR